nr:MAG TPA: hypothetical protein [Caudoviricetes sp.]
MSKRQLTGAVCPKAMIVFGLMKDQLIIPFKGDFPLLNNTQRKEYFDEHLRVKYVDEMSMKWQAATSAALKIDEYQSSFLKFLWKNGVEESDFRALSASEKSNLLVEWMSEERLDYGFLNINFDQYGEF